MFIFNFFKKIFSTLDDFREFLEDRLADVLELANKSETLDEAEKKLIATGINAGVAYFGGNISSDVAKQIAETVVEKGINKLNPKLVRQLRK